MALTLFLPEMWAHAGGLWLYEMGTPDVGTASAGMASRASDAATAFANPAGMTRLSESQLMVGLQPMYGDIKFDTQSSTYGGGNGGNAGGFVPDWQPELCAQCVKRPQAGCDRRLLPGARGEVR